MVVWSLERSGERRAAFDGRRLWLLLFVLGCLVAWVDGNLKDRPREGDGRCGLNSECPWSGITQGIHDVWDLDRAELDEIPQFGRLSPAPLCALLSRTRRGMKPASRYRSYDGVPLSRHPQRGRLQPSTPPSIHQVRANSDSLDSLRCLDHDLSQPRSAETLWW